MEPEDLSPEEQLKAENEVLKLKLELDSPRRETILDREVMEDGASTNLH